MDRTGRLANNYRIMRHGQSRANEREIIVSSIATDQRGDFGLTALGQAQALAAAHGSGLPASTLVFSSDFTRARQTAEIVRNCLGAAPAATEPALRERYFGQLDGGPVSGYTRVWTADAADAAHGACGAEPADTVFARAAALVAELERRYQGRDILLVSHGDTLQILQAGLTGLGPARHREVPHLEVAEIRRLALSAASAE